MTNEEYLPKDYALYRMKRANEALAEVHTLIENKYWNTAISRMYYAAFYAVGALLVKDGIETSSHSGTRQKFGQLYVKTGQIEVRLAKHYTDLFEKRHKSDYNDFFDYDEESVLRLFPLTKEFIQQITLLVNL